MSKAKKRTGLYSTTEVQKKLDLTPKQLRTYIKIGLVSPTLKDGDGENNKYNYYDEAALRKIHVIKIYRDLGFPLETVKSILADPHKSNFDIITEQIHLLEEQKKRIELAIAMNSMIISYGIDPLTSTQNTAELYSAAEKYKQKTQDTVTAQFSAYSKEELLDILVNLQECLIKFEINKRLKKSFESEETVILVKSLLSLVGKFFPFNLRAYGVMDALRQARENEYTHKFLLDLTTDENLSYIHDALYSYYLHCFEDEIFCSTAETLYPFYQEMENFTPIAFYNKTEEYYLPFCISTYKMLGVTCSEGFLNFTWPIISKVLPERNMFDRQRKLNSSFQFETFYELIFYCACKYYDTHAEELGHEFYDISEKMIEN